MPWFDKRVETYQKYHEDPRDYLDFILLKRDEIVKKSGEDKVPDYLSLQAIYSSQVDNLGLGGFDTTATSTDWSMVFLMNNPEVQENVYKELKEVCGNKPPTLSDRN
eukprot:TRINITY_DN1301_c0_g1_i1.p1 TRINITY_DN1301_c0_g1~~TRINITY_DN1301_c0_g1_i1.p1  ORF type:complete len:107 (+),score=20.73 TRINITY_DN1301_c0_g1_i1:377-697(+)